MVYGDFASASFGDVPRLLQEMAAEIVELQEQRKEDRAAYVALEVRLEKAEVALHDTKNKCRQLYQEVHGQACSRVLNTFELVTDILKHLEFRDMLNASHVDRYFRGFIQRSSLASRVLLMDADTAATLHAPLAPEKQLPIFWSGPWSGNHFVLPRVHGHASEIRFSGPNHYVGMSTPNTGELAISLSRQDQLWDYGRFMDSFFGSMYFMSPMPVQTTIHVSYTRDIRVPEVYGGLEGTVTVRTSVVVGKANLGQMMAVAKELILCDMWVGLGRQIPDDMKWSWPGLMPFAPQSRSQAVDLMLNEPAYEARVDHWSWA